jgi:hypothetical protein
MYKNNEKDIPKMILGVKITSKGIKKYLVMWETRADGITPESNYVSSGLLRSINPDLIVDFFEGKLEFI